MPEVTTHGHVWFKCPPNCENLYCQFCEGGLGLCTVCDGFEGQLPTQCPGEKMTEAQKERVYGCLVDYRDGAWREGERRV